jgi:predicted nucleic acid-binding protein
VSDHILDSNILIRYLRKTAGYKNLLYEIERKGWMYISVMTRLEVVRGMQERERKDTFDLLDMFETAPMTLEIADLAGELIRSYRGRGIILSDADAIIAATALQHGLVLVTTNAKHFPMPELVIFQGDEQGNFSPYKSA